MRIGQFIDTDSRGGAETVVIELSRALAAAGHDPLVLHFGSGHLDRCCRRFGLPQAIVPAHPQYKSTRSLPRFAIAFARFLRGERIDALHAHLFGPVTAAALAARLAGVPSVGTLHDVYSITEKPSRIRLLQLSALLGCRLLTVSRDMQASYRAHGYFPRHQLQTVYNGVPASRVSAAERAATRAALGLPEAARIVLCVGRLVPLKRHDLLIHALAALPRPHDVFLLCAGAGPRLGRLRQLAAECGVADRVAFLGDRDDIPALLAIADVFALASETEGLSCSLLESMAAGRPAVVTDVGGNRELVVDGDTGYLVAGEAPALSAALGRLLADSGLRQRMGAAAAARAAGTFSFSSMTSAYLARYGPGADVGRPRGTGFGRPQSS